MSFCHVLMLAPVKVAFNVRTCSFQWKLSGESIIHLRFPYHKWTGYINQPQVNLSKVFRCESNHMSFWDMALHPHEFVLVTQARFLHNGARQTRPLSYKSLFYLTYLLFLKNSPRAISSVESWVYTNSQWGRALMQKTSYSSPALPVPGEGGKK